MFWAAALRNAGHRAVHCNGAHIAQPAPAPFPLPSLPRKASNNDYQILIDPKLRINPKEIEEF